MRTLILSTFLYACESWTLTAELKRRSQALELRCYRRLLNISYKVFVTNEEARNRIQNAIGVHDNLLHVTNEEVHNRIQNAIGVHGNFLHVMNEEVGNRIQNAIGVHDDLQTMVKKQKLRWYGHISRSSGMVKTILQGIVKGARRRGRQKKKWESNIKEWTGMEFGDSLRAAEDRERWKGIVATSFVVPSWLRD